MGFQFRDLGFELQNQDESSRGLLSVFPRFRSLSRGLQLLQYDSDIPVARSELEQHVFQHQAAGIIVSGTTTAEGGLELLLLLLPGRNMDHP